MAKKSSAVDATPSMPGEEMMGKFPKYKVEGAMRTITEAHQHMADPEMMTHVKKLAKTQGSALQAIQNAPGADDEESEAQDSFKKEPTTKNLRSIYHKKFGKANA
jgi:hypothetical protein